MTRYRLRFGKEIELGFKKEYNNVLFHNMCGAENKYLCLHNGKNFIFCDEGSYAYELSKITFTQEEVDSLPYGIMKYAKKVHVETEEELYYIKLKGFHKEEYSYINVYNDDFSKLEIDSNIESPKAGYRTKFTLKEIKDNLPEYEKLKVNVRVDERVSF